ncbi:MAG: HPr family phosphocarrier protein [Candidatus Izemoplasmataceae bacterium]|jgi:phosphocarrier protein HPr|uniref:HPr family phosphocarrier protein n=1 Tax=Liberiplasma polymorphum TaxID=3374570 RepID=UPI0037734010
MKKEIIISSTAGLHAALASKVVHAASRYNSDIRLIYADKIVDAKSILGLMSLAIPSGENIVLVAEGPQADQVITDIEKILG